MEEEKELHDELGKVQSLLESLKTRLVDIDNRLVEVETLSNPVILESRIEEVERTVDVVRANSDVSSSLVRGVMEDRLVEIVSDEQLQAFYHRSGAQLKNVAAALSIEESTASRLVNGKIRDIEQRHKLKQYCLQLIRAKNRSGISTGVA